MALHGHTKIELLDVKTGDVEVIEKDNLVTNYLHDAMQPNLLFSMNNALGYRYYSHNLWPSYGRTISSFFKGIVCTSNVKEENANKYFADGSDLIVAHSGRGVSNSDLTSGTFNSLLSSVNENSATFVWDWDAEHGNGTISSVCLAPVSYGHIGNGGAYVAGTDKPEGIAMFSGDGFVLYTESNKSGRTTGVPLYMSMKNNKFVCLNYFTNADKKIGFNEIYVPASAYDPYKITEDYVFGNKYGWNGSQNVTMSYNTIKEIDLSSVITANNNYFMMFIHKNDFYFGTHSANSLAANSTIKMAHIDLDTMQLVGSVDIKNTTTAAWPLNLDPVSALQKLGSTQTLNSVDRRIYCDGEYIILPSNTNNKMCKVKISNSADTTIVDSNVGWQYVGQHFGRLFIGNGNVSMYDKTDNTIKASGANGYVPILSRGANLNNVATCYTYKSIASDSELYSFIYDMNSGNYGRAAEFRVYPIQNPFAYSTINTLDAPVTKTADKTMRITYTLTRGE